MKSNTVDLTTEKSSKLSIYPKDQVQFWVRPRKLFISIDEMPNEKMENFLQRKGFRMQISKKFRHRKIHIYRGACRTLLQCGVAISLGLFNSLSHADDLDDIESDMETALSESDAAQSEAAAARNREKIEQENLEKAQKEAESAVRTAKQTETIARKEIKSLENQISKLKAEQEKYNKKRIEAEQKIVQVQKQVESKKLSLTQTQALREAALQKKTEQEGILARHEEEKKNLEDEIVKNKQETKENEQHTAEMKKRADELERQLLSLRKNAQTESIRVEKAQLDLKNMKRRVAAVPKKVILRRSKYDCQVFDEPNANSKTNGHLQAKVKYEIYRVVAKKWVFLQFGTSRGYVARDCF